MPAGTCDTNTLAVAVNAAADFGLVSVAASGNEGKKTTIIAPACASKAVAVGAVYSAPVPSASFGGAANCEDRNADKDTVVCFSNR